MRKVLWLAPALAVTALAQGPVRDGKLWTDTASGTIASTGMLRVSASGAVTVRGEARADVAYTVKRRARTTNAADAQKVLESMVVRSFERAGWTVIEVADGDPRLGFADIFVRVPRILRETVVSSRGGAVQVVDLAGAVRTETIAGPVEADQIHGSLTIKTGGGPVKLGRVSGTVECFSTGGPITAESLGGDAMLNTGGGEIVVREAKGLVRARTLGGSIRVERAAQGVRIAAGSGLIDVAQAGGPVVAETGSGSIRIQSASNVECQSGNGAIQVRPLSGSVRADTKSGSILVDLSGAQKLQNSALSASNGDITVLIPSNLAVTVQAINNSPGSHRIVSDFSEIRARLEQGNVRSAADGAINGGGPVLRLTTTAGTIYIRRQAR